MGQELCTVPEFIPICLMRFMCYNYSIVSFLYSVFCIVVCSSLYCRSFIDLWLLIIFGIFKPLDLLTNIIVYLKFVCNQSFYLEILRPNTVGNNIYLCISFVSGLTVSKLLSVQLNCLSRKSQQQNLGFLFFFFIKYSMLNCNGRSKFVL